VKALCLFVISPILVLSSAAFAAACCGGGFSVPSLITGDDAGVVTTSLSYSKIATDVSADGLWTKDSQDEITKTLKIDAAHIFADRYQVGASLPVVLRTRGDSDTTSGLGDSTAMLGYEYLPDWDYHPLRPKGIGFLQLTLPTGKSIYESQSYDQLDTFGRGFWAIGLGTSLTKTIHVWDFASLFEFHRSFAKSMASDQAGGPITAHPGWGGSLNLSAGWNKGNLRLGGGLSWIYEDSVDVTGAMTSEGAPQRYATGSLVASYMWSQEWAGNITYSDQTLFGNPLNTTLSKSVVVSLQRRWDR
jgi:hypothetical protein